MRLTCLKCGHQLEVAIDSDVTTVGCVCGLCFDLPTVFDTGVQPNVRAAFRSRYNAFRAAGLVRNIGGLALGLAGLGILFFPLGLVGAVIGLYCITMLRGPLGIYSGRHLAILAIFLGTTVFIGEGMVARSWLQQRWLRQGETLQNGVRQDLRRLRRAQLHQFANTDHFVGFKDFRFSARSRYSIYLSKKDVRPGMHNGERVWTDLPEDYHPMVAADSFSAIAVFNLDGDADLDIWAVSSEHGPRHIQNDLVELLEAVHGPKPKYEVDKPVKDEPPNKKAQDPPAD